MQKKSDGFHDFSMADAMRLAQSDAGQQLFALLQSTQGQQLQAAMAQASAGNYDEMKQTVQALMASQQVQELVKQMQEGNHG